TKVILLAWEYPAAFALAVFGLFWFSGLATAGGPGLWLYGGSAVAALIFGLMAAITTRIAPTIRTIPSLDTKEAEKKPQVEQFDLRANLVAGLVVIVLVGLGAAGWAYYTNWQKEQAEQLRLHNLQKMAAEEARQKDEQLIRQWQGFQQQEEEFRKREAERR